MNIIKMYMNNVIILILAVRICEDSDTRGSDKRGYTVYGPQLTLTLCKVVFSLILIGERAKRARHSQVSSIKNRDIYIVRMSFLPFDP